MRGDDYAPDQEEISTYDNMGFLIETEYFYNDGEDSETNDYTNDYVGNCTRENLWYSKTGAVSDDNRYTYDAMGNVLTVQDSLGNVITNTYDLSGRLISTTDPKGSTTTYTYDALNRLIKQEQPFATVGGTTYNAITTYEYDAAGNVISESVANNEPGSAASARTTEYEYDTRNQVITAVMHAPEANYTQYRYDAAGNLTRVYTGLSSKLTFSSSGVPSGSDSDYAVTTYVYDNRAHMVKMTDALGQFETYDYDKNGSVASKTDRNGSTTAYTYDAMGRPLSTRVSNAAGDVTDTMSYTYTRAGLLRSQSNGEHTTTYTYDDFGRVTQENTDDMVIFNTYELMGNRTKRVVNKGASIIATATYAYDDDGRMTSVTDQGVSADYTYDANGNRTSVSYSNGNVESYTYNLANYPVTLTNKNGSSTLSSFSYTYAVDGNVLEKAENGGKTTTYAYDGMNRLTSEIEKLNGSTVQTYAYAFDDFGNRTSLTATGENTYTTAYSYDANNHVKTEAGIDRLLLHKTRRRMKETNIIFLLLSIALLTCCTRQSQEDNSPFSEPAASANAPSAIHGDANPELITPSAMLQAQVDMGFPDEKNIIELTGVADYAYPMTLEAITPQSIAIVEATVNDIEYSSVGGHAWTKVTATTDAVLYDELSENDVIDFYVFGGYMPLKEYIDWWDDWSRFGDLSDDEIENSVIHSLQPDEDLPLEGERYLFFLGAPTANMPEGTFQRLGQKFCTYHIEADGETLTHVPLVSELTEEEYLISAQSNDDPIQTISKDELYTQIEELLS